MTIIRNGQKFVLTDSELFSAYEEQQHIYDLKDIIEMFAQSEENDLMEDYGLSRSQVEALMDDMAWRMRKYMDRQCVDEEGRTSARDEAIKDVITEFLADCQIKEANGNGVIPT